MATFVRSGSGMGDILLSIVYLDAGPLAIGFNRSCGRSCGLWRPAPPVAASPPLLLLQPDGPDLDPPLGRLDHVIDRERGRRCRRQRLHLDAGAVDGPCRRPNPDARQGPVDGQVDVAAGQAHRVTERNQLGRPSGGHDPGQPRHRQDVSLAPDAPEPPPAEARSTRRKVSRFILTAAEAVAARSVSGLAATSTMRAAPRASTCDRRGLAFHSTVTLLARLRGWSTSLPLGHRDRVAQELQRQHREERLQQRRRVGDRQHVGRTARPAARPPSVADAR